MHAGQPFFHDNQRMNSIHLPMRWALYLLMAVVLLGMTACSTTRPWVNAPLVNGIVTPDPDDVQALVEPVLAHRMITSGESQVARRTSTDVLHEIVRRVPIPSTAR